MVILAPTERAEGTDDYVVRMPDRRPVMTMRGGEKKRGSGRMVRGAELFFGSDKRSALRGF